MDIVEESLERDIEVFGADLPAFLAAIVVFMVATSAAFLVIFGIF